VEIASEIEAMCDHSEGRVHLRRHEVRPPTPAAASAERRAEVHDDVGFISYGKAAQKLVLRQFHIEGFVNHYVLDSISETGARSPS
jgi:hypothetical protein